MPTVASDNSVRLQAIREGVRRLLTGSTEYHNLDSSVRRDLARGLVQICSTALDLKDEADVGAAVSEPVRREPLATAQSAGREFSGVAADRVARTTQQILNAVSFPRFVTELINGVFKALVDSNQQQLSSYVELIRNVAASTGGFAEANVGLGGARQWLAERFPESFMIEGESDPFGDSSEPLDPEEQAERNADIRLRLRPGASMPSETALRTSLGLDAGESMSAGDPENLVPLARAALARNRQQMLSTMVMLGLQRIVIESGRLHASMRFHIDTRSAAENDRGSQFDARHTSTASGSFGYGPWGASATMTNTIGFVSTDKTHTTEEMNTDLDLNSSVELVFKTDYLPLDRLAGRGQVDRIKVNTLNPESELKASTEAREAREKRIAESEAKRREVVDRALPGAPTPPAAPRPGEPGSPEAAKKSREDAEAYEREEAAKKKAKENKSDQTAPRAGSETPARAGSETPARAGSETPAPAGAETGVRPPPPASVGRRRGGRQAAGAGTAQAQSLGSEEQPETPPRHPDVIFAPTCQEAVHEMLTLAQVKPGELLYDLGCGDGRILVTAAKSFGCRAVGFDVDPQRVAEARANAARNGVSHMVRVEQRDLFEVDLSEADVVTLYLLPHLNVRLIPQIARMKPGARIVSEDFDMQGVIPDRVVQVYLKSRRYYKSFYLWTTPLQQSSEPVRFEWSNAKGIAC